MVIGHSVRLDQAVPCALEHGFVFVRKKIAINNQSINMVKVFRN